MPERSPLAMAAVAVFMTMTALSPLACEVPDNIALSAPDTERIGQFDTSRARGMGEAMLSDLAGERAVVAGLFSTGIQAIDTIPDGRYRCRTIKMGGILPLTVYQNFYCTVSAGGREIKKTSGSQRFTGSLTPAGDGLFYQGAIHYNDDPVRAYGQDAQFDQVGCLYRLAGQNAYRLELPYPIHESTHDVIELVPTR